MDNGILVIYKHAIKNEHSQSYVIDTIRWECNIVTSEKHL